MYNKLLQGMKLTYEKRLRISSQRFKNKLEKGRGKFHTWDAKKKNLAVKKEVEQTALVLKFFPHKRKEHLKKKGKRGNHILIS